MTKTYLMMPLIASVDEAALWILVLFQQIWTFGHLLQYLQCRRNHLRVNRSQRFLTSTTRSSALFWIQCCATHSRATVARLHKGRSLWTFSLILFRAGVIQIFSAIELYLNRCVHFEQQDIAGIERRFPKISNSVLWRGGIRLFQSGRAPFGSCRTCMCLALFHLP